MPQRIGVQAVVDTSQLQAGVSAYLSAINRMMSATQNMQGNLRGFDSSLNSLTGSMRNVTGASTALQAGIGAALGTAAIQSVVALGNAMRALSTEVIEQVGFWERLGVSLKFFTAIDFQSQNPGTGFKEALAATSEEAEGTMYWLQKLSILSPFTAQQVAQIYRVSQAMGLTKSQADATIEPLLDMGAAAGLSGDVLERVAIAMGQVEARGKLTGEEIRQFANAGIPIRKILVESLGIANSEFDELLEDGALLTSDVLPRVIAYMQQFAGAAEEVSKTTITGLLSSLSEIGELGLAKFFGSATQEVREQLAALVEMLTNPQVFAGLEIIGREVGVAVSAAIDAIVAAVNGLIQAWINLDPIVKQGIFVFAGGVVALTAFAGAVGLVAAAIGLLINPFTVVTVAAAGMVAAWSTNWAGIASATEAAVASISGAIGLVGDILNNLISNMSDAGSTVLDIFSTVLSSAAEWGANIVTSFAEGIMATVNAVAEALAAIGQMIAYLLAPGSPPRLLPDLDKWGTEAANVWLDAWTDADFSILDSITGDMKRVLQGAVNAGQLDEKGVTGLLLGSGNAIAGAIDEIRRFGWATQQTINKVISVTGQASEQVVGYLTRYTFLADAQKKAQEAQVALNSATARYADLLSPLQARLNAITDAQKKANDDKEMRRLQRVVNNRYATEAQKKMALLKIDEITTQNAITATERERDAVLATAQNKLDAGNEAQRLAQEEMDLFKQRIAAQTSQYDLMKQIETATKGASKAAGEHTKAAKKALTPLEIQLKLVKLQQEELRDLVEAHKAKLVLADKDATAAEKAAAALKLQEISLNQQQRDLEVAELGYAGILDNLRKIKIVLADIEKGGAGAKGKKGKGVGALGGIAADLGDLQKLKISESFDEYKKAMADFQTQWDTTKASIAETINTINESLPSFLKLQDATGKTSPLLDTLSKAFIGIAAVLAGQKLVIAIRAIAVALGFLGGWATLAVAGIALVAAAWSQNWFDIQGTTAKAMAFLQGEFQKLADNTILGEIITTFNTFVADIGALWTSLATSSTNPAAVKANFDKLVADFNIFAGTLQEGVSQAAGTIQTKFTEEWLPAFTTWVAEVWPKLVAELLKLTLQVWTWIQTAATTILTKFQTEWLPAFYTWVVEAWPLLVTELAKLIGQVWTWIATAATTIVAKFQTEWIPAFTTWAGETWTFLAPKVAQLLLIVGNWIKLAATTVATKFMTEWLPAFTKWASETIPPLMTSLLGIATSVFTWISEQAALLKSKFTEVWLPAFVDWVVEVWPKVLTGLTGLTTLLGGWIVLGASWLATQFTTQWVPAMVKWVTDSVPTLATNLVVWIGGLIDWLLLQGLPLLIVALLDFATAFVDWVGTASTDILPKLGTFLGGLLGWVLGTAVPLLATAVSGLMLALSGWIAGNAQIPVGDSAWGKVWAALTKYASKVVSVITTQVIPSIVTAAGNMVTAFSTEVMKIFSAENIQKFADAAVGLGSDIIDGVIQGFSDGAASLNKGFNDAVDNAIDAVKQFAGIQSPSTLTRDEIGKPLAEGVNDGVNAVPLDALGEAIAKQLVKAMAELEAQTPGTMQTITDESLAILQTFSANMTTLFTSMTTSTFLTLSLWQMGVIMTYQTLVMQIELMMSTLFASQTLQAQTFYTTATTLLTEFTAAIFTLMTEWSASIVALTTTFFAQLDTLTRALAANLQSLWTGIKDTTTGIVVAMKDAVTQAFADMFTAIESIVKTIPGMVMKYLGEGPDGLITQLKEDFVTKGEEVGNEFAQGIADGITDKVGEIEEAARDAINDTVAAARRAMASASPSKRTAKEIGAPFAEGIAVGIANGGKSIMDQVAAVVASATGSNAFSAGKTIGQQIASGITATAGAISGAVSGAVGGAITSPIQLATAGLAAGPAMSGVGSVTNYNYTRNYNLNLSTSGESGGLARDFKMMEIMAL
jgi:tape measure domain-containing protein